MTHLTLTTQMRKKPYVTQIMVDHELIIMQATNQTYFNLNPTGAKIWALFDMGGVTMVDLALYLQKAYHLDVQRSIQDAHQFIELLMANDLIDLITDPAS